MAKAAYLIRAPLTNLNTGERYNYGKREGLLHSGFLIPSSSPSWVKDLTGDLQKFWSMVERCERRKDAQLAREIILSLPHILSVKQCVELVEDYVTTNFVDNGMIPFVAIHPPSKDGDQRNVHAHILLTTREVKNDGFGHKVRAWNHKKLLVKWREGWASILNQHLQMAGRDERFDHRSLKDQGLNRVPTIPLGPIASKLERKGVKTARGDKLRKIIGRNNRAAEKEYWSQRQAEHKRNFALANIKRDMRNNRDLNKEDIHNLSPDDHERIEKHGFFSLKTIIQDWELHRDIGGMER